ncbi:MAG: peptidylprolyl isomerase [Verrucomicrobiae bacterium]|nr:peptidylprolyl isomerase [Verrucomicrobiae bacterium]
MKISRGLFTVVLPLLISLTACGAKEPTDRPADSQPSPRTDKTPVARVNGKTIERAELNAAVQGLLMQMMQSGRTIPSDQRDEFEWDVLNELINRELIVQEVKAKGAPNVYEKVAAEISRVEAQVGGPQELDAALAQSGLTRAEYEARVRDNLIIQNAMENWIAQTPSPTDDELQQFYNTHREQFREPQMVRARHILVRVLPQATAEEKAAKKAQIEALRTRLVEGEDFAKLAREFSEDTGSARNGGDLGFFPQGAMVPEFDVAAFTLETNELSEIITTQFGYHVLQVTDKKPAREVPLEEVKDRLATHLKRQKGIESAQQYINQLRAAAQIEILLPAPVKPAAPIP